MNNNDNNIETNKNNETSVNEIDDLLNENSNRNKKDQTNEEKKMNF